uniref:Putative ribose-5-phosphate isomerase 3ic n=1 Tax=Rhizophora mucronata TaxID=61149 RepID=A0A2P2KE80_RHIMU
MDGNSIVNATPLRVMKVSSNGNVRVDDEKVDDHGCDGVLLNGDEEVESPKAGMVFASEDEVYGYYNKYAQRKGFGIMRRSSRCDDDGRLVYFILACSQSGKDRSIAKGRFQWRQTSKTNCRAKINVVLDSQGQFHMCNVVLDHNHELTPGKLHRTICKKSRSCRLKKRRPGKEQAGPALCPDLRSIFGEPGGCENLSPDSSLGGASFSNQLANGDKRLLCSYNGHSVEETMFNCSNRRSSLLECSQNSQDSLRRALAKRAVALVKSEMVIGLGTGSTLSLVIEELGKLIREGKLKNIVAVGANYMSRIVARQLGMATVRFRLFL